jgi:hypothetical protein
MSPPTVVAVLTARSAPALSLETAAQREDFADVRLIIAVPDASPALAPARLPLTSRQTIDAAPGSTKRFARGPPLATVARQGVNAGVRNIVKQDSRLRLASATAGAAPSQPADSVVSRMERRARARALGIAAPLAGTAAPPQRTAKPGASQRLAPARPGPATSRCGSNGKTCKGSTFGTCCSLNGFCGSTADHCGAECQSSFGMGCNNGSGTISTDGQCGNNGKTCKGSVFGDCCSSSGLCGSSTTDYGAGCKRNFGTCSSGSGWYAPSSPAFEKS